MVSSNVQLRGSVDKHVICLALCFSHGSGDEDIPDVTLADNDIISYLSLPISRVHPGSHGLVCQSEQCVCDEEFLLSTFAQEQKAIAFHLANAVLAKHPLSWTAVPNNPGVEVAQQN